MLSAAIKSFSQVFEPSFRSLLFKALGLTLLLLLVVWIAIQGVVGYFIDLPLDWQDTTVSIVTGIGALIGLGFMLAPVSAMVVAFYQDQISDLVEEQSYPNDRRGKALPLGESIVTALRFVGVVIVANIFALMLFFIPGIGQIAFLLINGYLLGREYFEFVAMRFMPTEEAKVFRKSQGGTVFAAGLIIAFVLAVPILNLITPLFATIFMVHMFKKLRTRRNLPV
ncbi:CysZ-like protein [Pseudovibrio axinellae]|uniref:CysZ-like protein n=1 Tax=Pseudovibrio axinellae TaxID=989403 RepID=A0A166A161_9HYPH|nr:sulfate transporter family protein [Pseudovibrio axinellae]KZL20511.1 CysZ-like protein [Pseudovibrio axinellae]SEQ36076.1 CysZ protein [Pseudovibrio axinellae]